MAQIVSGYDLSLGDTESTVITNPYDVRVDYKIENAKAGQIVKLHPMIDNGNDYKPLNDDKGEAIVIELFENANDSVNLLSVNASNLKFEVSAPDAEGTLNVYTHEG